MITADEARDIRANKGLVNHATYKEILANIDTRIRARTARGEIKMEYYIPPLVTGRPAFQVLHAARYCAEKLRRAGYAVDQTDNVLVIDWTPPPPAPVPDAPVPRKRPVPRSAPPRPQPAQPTHNPKALAQRLESLKHKLGM